MPRRASNPLRSPAFVLISALIAGNSLWRGGALAEFSTAEMQRSLDNLVAALETYVEQVDARVQDTSKQLLTKRGFDPTLSPLVTDLQGDIQQKQSQLEMEQAKQKELVAQRDLAWDKYQTLLKKSSEFSIAEHCALSSSRAFLGSYGHGPSFTAYSTPGGTTPSDGVA